MRSMYFVTLGAVLAAGCAGDGEAMKKRLANVQDEVTRLQGQQDLLEDRVAGLQTQMRQLAARPGAARAPAPEHSERPRLKVIRLSPSDGAAPPTEPSLPETQADGVDDAAPRPVIRARGERVMEIEEVGGPTSSRAGQPERRSDGKVRFDAGAPAPGRAIAAGPSQNPSSVEEDVHRVQTRN